MMKKNELILICVSLLLCQIVNAQNISFTKNEILKDERLTNSRMQTRKIDYDDDGDQDIVVLNTGNFRQIQVFVNNGNQFDSAVVLLDGFTTSLENITVADVDHDGLEDIVFTSSITVYTLLNLGNGNFSSANTAGSLRNINISSNLYSIDINKDSFPDLVYVKSNQIRWLENDSSGNFNTYDTLVDFTTYHSNNNLGSVLEVYVKDIENDGDLDYTIISSTSISTNTVQIAIDSSGTYIYRNYNIDSKGQISVADFNNDNIMDIATIDDNHTSNDQLKVYLIDSTYSIFNNTTIYTESASYYRLDDAYAADVNGDGQQDLIAGRGTGTSGIGLIFLNDSNGTTFSRYKGSLDNAPFGNNTYSSIDLSNAQLISHDFNQDGRLDFVTSTSGNDDIIYHEHLADSSFNSSNYLNTLFYGEFKKINFFDVNQDGHKDFILSDRSFDSKVQVNYNDGNQSFYDKEVVLSNISRYNTDGLITDLNSDGNLDLLYSTNEKIFLHSNYQNPLNDSIWLLFNSSYNGGLSIGNNRNPNLLVVDIDLDGDHDIVFVERVSSSSETFNLIENINNSSFTHTAISGALPFAPQYFQLADIDNDNKVELVYFSGYQRMLTARYDSSTKSLTAIDTVNTTYSATAEFQLSDLDNDGDLDVVGGLDDFRWFENVGGTQYFKADSVLSTLGASNGYRTAVGDLNNDGLDDYAAFGGSSNNRLVNTFINQGNRSFIEESHQLGESWNYNYLSMEDVDADGKDDIVLNVPKASNIAVPYWFRTCFETLDSISAVACGTYNSPSGKIFTSSGIINDTIMNADGCDSIITINLTINQSTTNTTITQNGNTLSVQSGATSYQWLDCNNAFTIIPGETNNTYTPSGNGDYAVEVSNGNCTDTSLCYNTTITGLTQNDKAENQYISIYPNPSSCLFNIDLGETSQSGWYQIKDIQGKVLRKVQFNEQQLIQLDLNQSTGIYIIELKTDEGIAIKKLIKQ
jgi:hypothetical protein